MDALPRIGTLIILFSVVTTLTALDILTTHYVISNSLGFEANELIAGIVGDFGFYCFKFFFTLFAVFVIALFCRNDKQLMLASYTTLTLFYSVVVANNLLVIFAGTDFGLNLPKLLLLFLLIFVVSKVSFGYFY